jgi:hypothetical protein
VTSSLLEDRPAGDGSLSLFARPLFVVPPPLLLDSIRGHSVVPHHGHNQASPSPDYHDWGGGRQHQKQGVVDHHGHHSSSFLEYIGIIERALSIVDWRLFVDEEVDDDDGDCSLPISSSSSDHDDWEQDGNHDNYSSWTE